jgi:hypothetical protein
MLWDVMKRFTFVLTTLGFGFSCFGLWVLLNLLSHISAQATQALPGFTRLLLDLRWFLLVLPIPVLLYCAWAIFPRRSLPEHSATAFVACVMSALSFVFFPVMLGLFLPCVVLMEQAWIR